MIAVNTMLASAGGALASLLYLWERFTSPDIAMACNGLLGGLVAITASCAFVTPAAAVLIGVIAGLIVVAGVLVLERRLRIDDPVGAIAVHGVCGLWGALALGLFADGSYGDGWNGVAGPVRGLLYGDPGQFVAQLIGVDGQRVVVFGLAFAFFMLIERTIGNRVHAEVEWSGLDRWKWAARPIPIVTLSREGCAKTSRARPVRRIARETSWRKSFDASSREKAAAPGSLRNTLSVYKWE